jgi:hypothetical protein
LRILYNAAQMDDINPADNPDTPLEAIAALADLLYNQPESFCQCTEDTNADTPLCPSFHNFKTLMFETLDACTSLDEIDCDAWAEFFPPCQTNFQAKYSSTGFSTNNETLREQCRFIHEEHCGGDQPFPIFRRLDCQAEVSDEAWRFFQDYSKTCLGNTIAPTPAVAPTPAAPVPTPAIAPTPASAPTKPYVPPPDNRAPYSPPEKKDKKPYIPPEERGKPSSSSSSSPAASDTPKKKSHWFRNLFWLLLLGGLGYYCYQRRCADSFNINRYRRMASLRGRTGNFFGGGPGGGMSDSDGMYSGLAMDSSTTFEPPSLPPPPSTFT